MELFFHFGFLLNGIKWWLFSILHNRKSKIQLGFAFPWGGVGGTAETEPEELGIVADCKGNNLSFLMMDGT